jgi:hypothetical protein
MATQGDYVRAGDVRSYYAKVSQSTAQSIPNNVFTARQFNGNDDTDTLGVHDPVTSNSQINIGKVLGWWMLTGVYASAGTAAGGGRRVRWLLNGTTGVNGAYVSFPTASGTAITGGFWAVESTALVQATAAADYVELQGLQDTGGALNTQVSGDLRCAVTAVYLGT